MNRRARVVRVAILLVGLAGPALASEQTVDGLIIGKTRCDEAIRTLYARDRERVQAATEVPAEGSMEMNGLRAMLKKPKGDKTPYKVLYVEESKHDEQRDLEAAAKGPELRGLNTEECNPYGYMAMDEMASRALNLDQPVQVDVAALGVKKCPYVTNFVSVGGMAHRDGRLLCLDGVVGIYSTQVRTEFPKLRQEWAAKQGAPKDLGIESLTIDINTMTATRFQSGAAFRHDDGLVLLTGLGSPPDGPAKVTRKGQDFIFKMPTELKHDATTEVTYLSKAAVATLEQDKKLYDELAAKAAARKKKRR
ncbi:hypothetical protein [Pyxidicoccus caerfyrddinensis]|uniref:hypothetical protein n=1 Tax=Pyxidicoccus caerfyrddinensis TaxID=2709663 RepID=UPI0013DCB694|nr:hypothetical protein [Pyxidicoccus caerfyrddinensis]